MRRIVISTIGTSLLTNQINRANSDEKDWYNLLRDNANLSLANTPYEVLTIIETLVERAKQKLKQSQVKTIRLASAELNGIYGLYQEKLSEGKQDIHWLIATDTAQGQKTAEIVRSFLGDNEFNVNIYVPPGLSTASSRAFADGIDNLITWMQETIPSFKENGYQVSFNLVGSFKSLQGYLNTIGMFYADEIIYIFEGQNSDLITIPRLPITIDTSTIQPYKLPLALMDAGTEIAVDDEKILGIPESLVFDDGQEMTLSTWGKLVWTQSKDELLSQELLPFPHLEYKDSFYRDYEKTKTNQKERVKLQEILAKVSCLLEKSKGDTSILKGEGGVQYDKYTNKGDMAHFRVTQGLRISCTSSNGKILLHRYGKEPDVNNNPY
ncbi:CRISPR-associated protein [Planktothrix sp. FACHB-1355]|uniref:CRISPR-associated protein n=1 Tax=Aerosakkonema funiforme FACHB-1375 TaxID=2949571 RepID=A0A926VEN6_9CYAN|nr:MULTISPECIES: CRISPR-associated protein [Oscillatoriales]MBD2182389.1 CRISPR-associated protein [Aerosakkonema funiforme FACHB-1375]MBD3559253.1 CRISPR-associated protein [Planktothrix sp. FACHB-1355]